jgi:hypothetical protein
VAKLFLSVSAFSVQDYEYSEPSKVFLFDSEMSSTRPEHEAHFSQLNNKIQDIHIYLVVDNIQGISRWYCSALR